MVFSSNIFLFVFLPLFLAVYYLTPNRWRSLVIVVGSYAFYGWWRVDFLVLYVAVTFWSYYMGHLIASAQTPELAKLRCIIGVVGSVMVLGYFKYFNFFADNAFAAFGIDGSSADLLWRVILPIGVSFFIFESISYMVDIYRKDAPPARDFIDFAAFLALYPHLIAGPVMRYKDLSDQIVSRTHSWTKFAEGGVWFMSGLCKKVLIADSVAPIADTLFAQSTPSLSEAWLGAVAYTIQLYFDFSGYSEMAIGLGLMIGFRLIRNFDAPYTSRSITEFWRRWHISLSTWLRDYLYIPLGGSRKGKVRTYSNLFITMLLGGFWHGANWTFVLWGALHGGFLAMERGMGAKGKESPYPFGLGLPITLLVVIIGWILFRAPDVTTAVGFYKGMLGFNGAGFTDEMAWRIRRTDVLVMIIGIVFCYFERQIDRRFWVATFSPLPVSRASMGTACMVVLSFVAVLKLAADSYSPFLYFQF